MEVPGSARSVQGAQSHPQDSGGAPLVPALHHPVPREKAAPTDPDLKYSSGAGAARSNRFLKPSPVI